MVDAATVEKLEAGFKKLQAASDCKSLLKKYLTREVLDACKDKKTAMGATLLDVVQSGESSYQCIHWLPKVIIVHTGRTHIHKDMSHKRQAKR